MKTRDIFLALSASTALVLPAGAEAYQKTISARMMAEVRCFKFDAASPQRQFNFSDLHLSGRKVTGCYLRLDDKRQLAFLKTKDGADKLASALIETSGTGLTLEHFSMTKGDVIRAKQNPYAHNPLPIPASLEEALAQEDPVETAPLRLYSDDLRRQLNEIVENYFNKNIPTVEIGPDFGSFPENALVSSYHLPPSRQPMDGYWWPHKGIPLADGPNSPLAKYDAYVQRVTGVNPKSYEWERAHHFTNTFWAGHCNGWVSSSILYGYDGVNLRDRPNGNIISSSDLQGLRAATSYCVSTRVVGRRYRGEGSDLSDPNPADFHKTLDYYIRFMRKPVAMDYLSGDRVDNHIISGYDIEYKPAGPRKALVTATLKVHGYSYAKVSVKRPAKSYKIVYSYYLYKDSRGRLSGGRWVDPRHHPDFLWVPLSQSRCSGENPRMNHKYVDQMIRRLPRARTTRW